MEKFIYRITYAWNKEIEAENEEEAFKKAEKEFLEKEEKGELGQPDFFDHEILTVVQ